MKNGSAYDWHWGLDKRNKMNHTQLTPKGTQARAPLPYLTAH